MLCLFDYFNWKKRPIEEANKQAIEMGIIRSFLVLVVLVAISFEATTATARPGFLYSRTRGSRCTPQYWSSGTEAWPGMVPQTSTVSKVFGSRASERYRYDLTMLESTTAKNEDENAFAALLKQASAALLNSYSRKGFPYSAWEVKTLLIQALVSKEAAATQAKQFAMANRECNY